MFADMHTHSEFSHDSICRMEDMCAAQLERGTRIFAVTDHFDSCSADSYDVFTPIRRSYETVQRLNDGADGAYRILAGIEIGESFRCPQVYEKVRNLVPFDVVIGSVHLVEHRGEVKAYSKTDFSAFSMGETEDYLGRYFEDMRKMIDFLDFDILAHLTCPLRYITGKYGIKADLSCFDGQIRQILERIIEKGIALEVNTSSLDHFGELMPSGEILRTYYALGGRRITLGSDAHVAERASMGFEAAAECLGEIGFSRICYYQNRIPRAISLTGETAAVGV